MSKEEEKVWVLWWKYSDGSEQGILRVYEDETRAAEDLALVKENFDREYILSTIRIFKKVVP